MRSQFKIPESKQALMFCGRIRLSKTRPPLLEEAVLYEATNAVGRGRQYPLGNEATKMAGRVKFVRLAQVTLAKTEDQHMVEVGHSR